MCVVSMELASCHPSDAFSFEVTIRFLEILRTTGVVFINTSKESHFQATDDSICRRLGTLGTALAWNPLVLSSHSRVLLLCSLSQTCPLLGTQLTINCSKKTVNVKPPTYGLFMIFWTVLMFKWEGELQSETDHSLTNLWWTKDDCLLSAEEHREVC